MSGNVMKKVELNYEKESMIYRYLDSFANFIKTDSKEDKEKLARETIEVMELVATQNAIKAEETKKEIKSEVLEDIRKEMVTKDYIDQKFDYVDQQFKATKDYIDQKFQAERDYVNQRFDYVDQQFQATKDYVDVKITRAKYSILILVGIILASVISAGYVYVNDVKTELKEDIRRIEDTNQRILDILISQSKKD